MKQEIEKLRALHRDVVAVGARIDELSALETRCLTAIAAGREAGSEIAAARQALDTASAAAFLGRPADVDAARAAVEAAEAEAAARRVNGEAATVALAAVRADIVAAELDRARLRARMYAPTVRLVAGRVAAAFERREAAWNALLAAEAEFAGCLDAADELCPGATLPLWNKAPASPRVERAHVDATRKCAAKAGVVDDLRALGVEPGLRGGSAETEFDAQDDGGRDLMCRAVGLGEWRVTYTQQAPKPAAEFRGPCAYLTDTGQEIALTQIGVAPAPGGNAPTIVEAAHARFDREHPHYAR